MCSWGTTLPILQKRLYHQILTSKSACSCIVGSVQETMKEGKTNLEWLNELLNIFKSPITDWNVVRDLPVAGPYLKSFEVPCIEGNSMAGDTLYRLTAFKYKDAAKPMFTFQLIYKTEPARNNLIHYKKE